MEFHKKINTKHKPDTIAKKKLSSKTRYFPSHSQSNVPSIRQYQFKNQTLTEKNIPDNIFLSQNRESPSMIENVKKKINERINTSGLIHNVPASSLVINLRPKYNSRQPVKKYYSQIKNANPMKQMEYQHQFQSLTSSQKSIPNSYYVTANPNSNSNSKEKNSNSSTGLKNIHLHRSENRFRNNIHNTNSNSNELEIEINNDEDNEETSPKIRYHRPRKFSPIYPYGESEEVIYNNPYTDEESNENQNLNNQYFDAYEINEGMDPVKVRLLNNKMNRTNIIYGNPFLYSSDEGQENSSKFEEDKRNKSLQKKFMRKFTDIYDPAKNKKGLLVLKNKMTIPLSEAPTFNEDRARIRYFSRNSKLSDIIMTKKQISPDPLSIGYDDFYSGSEDKTTCHNETKIRNIKTFNRKSFEKFHEMRKSIKINKSPEQKFINVSLAMISSKGKNTENRPILRKMRFEKGGVVDLAQGDIKKHKFKYFIKKFKASPNKQLFHNNPKYREKAAEVIQDWWYAIKEYKKKKIQSAILIQSFFRGRFVRRYLYDVIYMNYLYFGFTKKIEKFIKKKYGPYFLERLYDMFIKKRNILKKIVLNYMNSILNVYFMRWKMSIKSDNKKKLSLLYLLRIRAIRDSNVFNLKRVFSKWNYIAIIKKQRSSIKDLKSQKKKKDEEESDSKEEDQKEKKKKKIISEKEKIKIDSMQKIKGLMKIISGANKFMKKNAIILTNPKIKDYMIEMIKDEKIKKIIKIRKRQEVVIIRKYFCIYYEKCFESEIKSKKMKEKIFNKYDSYSKYTNIDERLDKINKEIDILKRMKMELFTNKIGSYLDGRQGLYNLFLSSLINKLNDLKYRVDKYEKKSDKRYKDDHKSNTKYEYEKINYEEKEKKLIKKHGKRKDTESEEENEESEAITKGKDKDKDKRSKSKSHSKKTSKEKDSRKVSKTTKISKKIDTSDEEYEDTEKEEKDKIKNKDKYTKVKKDKDQKLNKYDESFESEEETDKINKDKDKYKKSPKKPTDIKKTKKSETEEEEYEEEEETIPRIIKKDKSGTTYKKETKDIKDKKGKTTTTKQIKKDKNIPSSYEEEEEDEESVKDTKYKKEEKRRPKEKIDDSDKDKKANKKIYQRKKIRDDKMKDESHQKDKKRKYRKKLDSKESEGTSEEEDFDEKEIIYKSGDEEGEDEYNKSRDINKKDNQRSFSLDKISERSKEMSNTISDESILQKKSKIRPNSEKINKIKEKEFSIIKEKRRDTEKDRDRIDYSKDKKGKKYEKDKDAKKPKDKVNEKEIEKINKKYKKPKVKRTKDDNEEEEENEESKDIKKPYIKQKKIKMNKKITEKDRSDNEMSSKDEDKEKTDEEIEDNKKITKDKNKEKKGKIKKGEKYIEEKDRDKTDDNEEEEDVIEDKRKKNVIYKKDKDKDINKKKTRKEIEEEGEKESEEEEGEEIDDEDDIKGNKRIRKIKKDKDIEKYKKKEKIDDNKDNKDQIDKNLKTLDIKSPQERIEFINFQKKYILKNLLRIKKKQNDIILRHYFNIWKFSKSKLSILEQSSDALNKKYAAKIIYMFIKNLHKKLLNKKFNQWRRIVNNISNENNSLKKGKNIYSFSDFIRNIITKKYFSDFVSKLKNHKSIDNKVLKKIIINLIRNKNRKQKEILLKYLLRWYITKDKKGKEKDNTIGIVSLKYIIKKIDKIAKNNKLRNALLKWREKKNKYIEGINSIDNKIKIAFKKKFGKKLFNDLEKEAKENWKLKILKKIIVNLDIKNNLNKKTELEKRFYLYKWKKIVDKIRSRNTLLKILLIKNDKENVMKLFHKWKCNIYKKLPKSFISLGIQKLYNILYKHPFKTLVNQLQKTNPNILKIKGQKLANVLDKLKLGNPYVDFFKKIKILNKLDQLKKAISKINNKNDKYLIDKYFKIWKTNKDLLKEKNIKIIVSWFKKQNEKNNKMKQKLLKRLLISKIKKDNNSLLFPLLYWNKILKMYKKKDLDDKGKQKLSKYMKKLYRKYILKQINKFVKNGFDTEEHGEKGDEKENIDNNTTNKKKNINEIKNEIKTQINKIKKDKDKFKLLITSKIKKDNLDKLRNRFNYWKNNTKDFISKIVILQTTIRKLLAVIKLDKIRRLNDLLLKIFSDREKYQNSILIFNLRKWNMITKKLDCIKQIILIQKYFRNHINRKQNNKYKNFFYDMYKNKLIYTINDLAKLNLLKSTLNGISKNKVMKKINEILKKMKIIKLLDNIIKNTDRRNKNAKMKYYISKWSNRINIMKKKDDKKLKTLLLRIFRKKDNLKNLLKSYYLRWKRIQNLLSIIDSVIKIQNKWRQKKSVDNFNQKKEIQKNMNDLYKTIKNSFKRNNYIKLINNLKNENKKYLLSKIGDNFATKRINNLKLVNEKIKTYIKYKFLSRAKNITDNYIKRIVKKYFDLWRNKTNAKNKASDYLNKFLNKKDNMNKGLLLSSLLKWLYHTKFNEMVEKVIYIQDKYRTFKINNDSRNNWIKLKNLLHNKENRNEIKEIIKYLKIQKAFNRLYDTLKNKSRKNILKALNRNNKISSFIQIMKKILTNINDNKSFILLKKYYNLWKNNVNKDIEREDKLNNLLYAIEKRMNLNSANFLYKVSLIKKLLDTITKIRKLNYFNKLRGFAQRNKSINNLYNSLSTAINDITNQRKKYLFAKILKYYAYHQILKLFEILDKKQSKIIKKRKTTFISILRKGYESSDKESVSTDTLKKKRNSQTSKTLFKPKEKTGVKQFEKSKTKNQGFIKVNMTNKDQKKLKEKEKEKDKVRKNVIVKGALNKYKTNNKYYNNNKTYDRDKESDTDRISISNRSEIESESEIINNKDNSRNLYIKLVKSLTKTINPVITRTKKEALFKFREIIINKKTDKELEEERVYYIGKLYKKLREITIKKLFIEKEDISRAKKLIRLIKITSINSQISTDRYIRQIIRRWRFISFVKNVSKKKLELMYKNLHVGYLEIINSLFNNECKFPSMMKEFENFGADIGMYKSQDGYLNREKELYQKIKKKYISKPIEYDKENSGNIESGQFINELKYKSDEGEDMDYIYMDSDKSVINKPKGVRRSLNYDRDK